MYDSTANINKTQSGVPNLTGGCQTKVVKACQIPKAYWGFVGWEFDSCHQEA